MTAKLFDVAATAKQIAGQRLAHRRFVSSLRPTDIFVVTFPKSGTRWIGFFLASIIAQIHQFPEAAPLTVTDYGGLVHDVNRHYNTLTPLTEFASIPNPRVFTVHTMWDRSLPRVIYLVRDPRSVLVSYYHHFQVVDAAFDRSMSDFVSSPPLDWGEHVQSWLQHADSNRLLLLRYEDLHEDPVQYFTTVAEFTGIHATDGEVAKAIESSRFDNMRRIEDTTQDLSKYADPSLRFMRTGTVDSWRNELSPELVHMIEERFKPLMDRLGYERAYA